MIAKYTKPNADRPNLNDYVRITGRQVGQVYRLYVSHTQGLDHVRKGSKDFPDFMAAYRFVADVLPPAMEATGWTRKR